MVCTLNSIEDEQLRYVACNIISRINIGVASNHDTSTQRGSAPEHYVEETPHLLIDWTRETVKRKGSIERLLVRRQNVCIITAARMNISASLD